MILKSGTMRTTILSGVHVGKRCEAAHGESNHGEQGIAEEAGCSDCGEEFAEASVLSGLAGGETESRGAATVRGAVLQACRCVPRTSAGVGRADRGPAAELDSGEPGGGRELRSATSEIVARFCGGRGRLRGRHHLLPRPAGYEGRGAILPGNLRGPVGGGSGGGSICV